MMDLCGLCGPETRNEAEYSVGVGSEDRELKVCRFCCEDLRLFGVKVNQAVRLPAPKFVLACKWFLGPVRSLFKEAQV